MEENTSTLDIRATQKNRESAYLSISDNGNDKVMWPKAHDRKIIDSLTRTLFC
jgi:hypothetical protein